MPTAKAEQKAPTGAGSSDLLSSIFTMLVVGAECENRPKYLESDPSRGLEQSTFF
jgi:hypothetical protein